MANPGPARFGTPPPPAGAPDADHEVLSGVAASPGTYRGEVRIVRDETEFERVWAGDVVVCPTTSPLWSLLFPIIGVLVTDEGGALSHPAIIAREHGVPAVVATRVATTTLCDGQQVVVDGGAGTVTAPA